MGSFPCFHKLLYHVFELFSQEYGHNRRRRFISTKTVIVSNIGCTLTQQIRMNVHSLDNAGKHQKELDIFIRGFTRIKHIHAIIRSQ